MSQLGRDDSEAFDCFNEDLIWILDKLVHRTGGVAGVISGHLTDEARPTLLAVSTEDGRDSHLVQELTTRAAAAPAPSGIQHDEPLLTHSLLNLRDGQDKTRRYRLLQLAFTPTGRVKIVATVAKDSRGGFNLIHESIARRLYPVLSRYVRLWWVHRAERRKAQALTAVIDRSPLAILLLNHDNQLLFGNARARSLLQGGGALQQQGNTIATAHASDAASLQAGLGKMLQVNQSTRSGFVGEHPSCVLQLSREPGRRQLIVAIVPALQAAVAADDPATILFALDPEQDLEALLSPICAIYKLTTAEARLVYHLASGQPVTHAAELMGIRPQTARDYLKQIFSKTRTHRQADLVRIMLTSALPALPAVPAVDPAPA